MTQPNWDDVTVDYDVLVAVYFGELTETYRFAYRRSVAKESIVAVTLLGLLDGVYDGSLISISSLRQSFGTEMKPKISYPTITLTIADNGSDKLTEFRDKLKECDYGSKEPVTVSIFLTDRKRSISPDDDIVFVGVLDPHAVMYRRDRIELRLTDRMKSHDVEIPTSIFDKSYSNYDPAWMGKPRPILFGDWSLPQDYFKIEVVCIYTAPAVGENLQFQLSEVPSGLEISDFGLEVRRVRDGGYDLDIPITATDKGAGTFEADGTGPVTYSLNYGATHGEDAWKEGDKWYVKNPVGLRFDTGEEITTPVDIWYALLTCFAGLDPIKIDSDSYNQVQQRHKDLSYKVRRWITQEQKLSEVLSELCYEAGFLTYVKADKFKVSLMTYDQTLLAGQTWYGCHFLKDRFETHIDPSSWQADGILLLYGYDPRHQSYDSIQLAGNIPHQRFRVKWIYDSSTASHRAGFFSLSTIRPPKLLKATTIKKGLDTYLADKVGVEHGNERGEEFQVFSINQNFSDGLSEVEGYSLSYRYSNGAWTENLPTDSPSGNAVLWEDADKTDRKMQGFWTDDDGYCDPSVPPDEDSNDSNWTEG